MENKVLIISHTFPPNLGIGGRRWAKFAKYLNKLSIEVYVLKERDKNRLSLWVDDIKGLSKDKIFNYDSGFPSILEKNNLNIYEKFLYKVALCYIKVFTKGNPYDRLSLIENSFIKKLDRIVVENNIKNIIVTGPPFNLLYYCSKYKKMNPHINLISDFRDGWTWDNRFGFSLLNKKRKELEYLKEKNVFLYSDKIITPSMMHSNIMKSKYPRFYDKIGLMPHGIDKDEFEDLISLKENYLIYGGTIYDGLDEIFKSINVVFRQMPFEEIPFFEFYLSNPSKMFNYLDLIDNEYRRNFVISNSLPPKDFWKKVQSAKAFIFFPNGINGKTNISTKVYEILYCKTPIILFGKEGDLSKLISDSKTGIFVENISTDLVYALKNIGMVKTEIMDIPTFENLTFELVNKYIKK